MADNYLEKKMEEHRRGATPAYRPKLTPRGDRPGTWSLPFAQRRVWVRRDERCCAELHETLVRQLASAGCRVVFVEANPTLCARLAQSSGACGVGSDAAVERVKERWEGIDVEVVCGIDDDGYAVAVTTLPDGRSHTVKSRGQSISIDTLVRTVMFTLVTGNDFGSGITIE